MRDVTDQLRQLGERNRRIMPADTPAEADAWHDVADRLAHPDLVVVPGLTSGLETRRRFLVTVTAFAAVTVTAGVVIGSRRARRDRLDVSSVGGASPGTPITSGVGSASTGGLPRVLLDPVPDGFGLTRGFDEVTAEPGDQHVVVLRSRGANPTVMTLTSWDGTGATMTGTGVEPVTVHGIDAVLQTGDATNSNVLWHDDAVTYQLLVAGPHAADRAFVLDVAGRVARTGPTATDVTISPVPDGFTVRYHGPTSDLTPGGGWQLDYDSPDGRLLTVTVTSGGLPASELATVHDYQPVTVASRPAFLGVGGPGAAPGVDPTNQTLVLDLADGIRLVLNAYGLTPAQVVVVANSLRVVDDATWRATVGDRLQPLGLATTPATTAP